MIKHIIINSTLLFAAMAFIPQEAGASSKIYKAENTSLYVKNIQPHLGNNAFGQGPDMDLDLDRKTALEFSEMSGTNARFRQRYSDNAGHGLDQDRPGMAIGLRMRYSFD